jgi:multidrug efflux pump subunit AcrB
LAGRVAAAFVDSKLTPLLVVASILLGVAALILLPREEEPQIRVPMIDVMVAMPGSGAREVEERATRPMEKLLWEVPGVEYLYSTSREGEALVIVRFKVGSDPDSSLVKISEKLRSNFDRIPHGVTFPMIKPRSIDDVPILALTLHGKRYDHLALRRVVAQLDDAVKQVPQVAETTIIGGARRQVRVLLDPVRLSSRGLTAAGIIPMLQQANRQFRSGTVTATNREIVVETGAFLTRPEEVGQVVVGVSGGRPVALREVADVVDGAEEGNQYVFFGLGSQAGGTGEEEAAVTLSIAKRPGANAISVAEAVLRKVDSLRGRILPADLEVSITRHYGATAAEKSNELLLHMGIAVVSVVVLIWLVLGWRESGVVGVAIPATLALTLLVFLLWGFTLNRITLFALIFSIGILVDDAIVVVENIVRHRHLPGNAERPLSEVAVEAVAEVGNPTILATFAVIAAVLPMAFVGGLMGPYMRPIPVGASAAMFWSLLIAFIVTPWAAVRFLGMGRRAKAVVVAATDAAPGEPAGMPVAESHATEPEDAATRLYRRVMGPLLHHRGWQAIFLGTITLMLLAAMAGVGVGWVKVKMLPFDNKSEFQVILNLPEGSSLERTAEAARAIAAVIRAEPEVTDYQIYAGVASPFNFNGLVRHYFLRRGASVADIQVNLVSKHDRKAQSHDIVKRVRPAVTAVAERFGARVALAEVPPGPPVLQTLVAEVYGPDDTARIGLATAVRDVFRRTPGVVDVDWYVEDPQAKVRFVIDKEKAALHGISAATLSQTLRLAVAGESIDLLHAPAEKEDVNLLLELPRSTRARPEELLSLRVRAGDGNGLPEPGATGNAPLVPLRELVRLETATVDGSRHRKNLMPVTYVIGDVAGVVESPVYAIGTMNDALAKLDVAALTGVPGAGPLKILNASMPESDAQPSLKWDGEWQITLEVFRDLGLAFAAVLVLIYVLMVGWFRSLMTPLVVMMAIPFSLVGILPAHGAMGAFFTATSMIGFMAGAGIVVRNSIILVDFIEQRVAEGLPLADAVVDAGAVRFRPMLLTAMAVVFGAAVILFDPIFQGLAISLMAGEVASLLISRLAVPVLYYQVHRRRGAA